MSPKTMTELAALALDLQIIDRLSGQYTVWVKRGPQEIAFSPLTSDAHAAWLLQGLPIEIRCDHLSLTGNRHGHRLHRRARMMGDLWPSAHWAAKDLKWVLTECAARHQLQETLEGVQP